MRIVTWNMGCGPRSRFRKTHEEAWAYLLDDLRPDIALVQEALVAKLSQIGREHHVALCELASDDVEAGTAIVVRGLDVTPGPRLTVSPVTYVPTITVITPAGPITVVSTHVYPGKQQHDDLSKLVELACDGGFGEGPVLLGGDFNSARRFGGRHKKFFAAMDDAGFHDAHWRIHGREVQTFFTRGEVQDDHFFVSRAWASKVISCGVLDNEDVRRLSDHGPVVLEMDVGATETRLSPKLDHLLRMAVEALPRSLASEVVVFGSTPMVFEKLKDTVNDLDLFVSEETFAALIDAGFSVDTSKPEVPCIRLADDVEVFKTWLGVTFDEVFSDAEPVAGSRGLRVAHLRHVLAGKLASDRPKDRLDIEALRRVLGDRG